jgi:hypothetical protein
VCLDGQCVSDGTVPDASDDAEDSGELDAAADDTSLDDSSSDTPGQDGPLDASDDAPADIAEPDTDPPDTTGDADTPDAADLPPDEPEACATARAEATQATLPVDILFFIDTSGSMNQETDLVEEKINEFVRFITRSNIDYHVVMVGSDREVCVPPPLSAGGCPDTDTDRYLHVRRSVGSTNGLSTSSR